MEKHQNPLPPIWYLQPSSGSPAESIFLAVLLPALGDFGYKFIFILKKKELMYSVLLFLSPLQCAAILGNRAKVTAAIYSRGRYMDLDARSLGWAWGRLPKGGNCALQSDVGWIFLLFCGSFILFQLLA